MRVGRIRVPLFTRELAEKVDRYLIHLSRTLEKTFREFENAVNDNDERIDADRMRRWMMDGY